MVAIKSYYNVLFLYPSISFNTSTLFLCITCRNFYFLIHIKYLWSCILLPDLLLAVTISTIIMVRSYMIKLKGVRNNVNFSIYISWPFMKLLFISGCKYSLWKCHLRMWSSGLRCCYIRPIKKKEYFSMLGTQAKGKLRLTDELWVNS